MFQIMAASIKFVIFLNIYNIIIKPKYTYCLIFFIFFSLEFFHNTNPDKCHKFMTCRVLLAVISLRILHIVSQHQTTPWQALLRNWKRK